MIHIFSTELKRGKGGISTALVGYVEYLHSSNIAVNIVTTHSGSSKLITFAKAILSALKVKKGDVCWFHCGPWFSMLRKTFLVLICKARGGRIVIHFHSRKTHVYINHPFGKLCLKLLYKLSSKFVVLTKWWRTQFIANGFEDKVIVSPNPIDFQLITYIERNKQDATNSLQVSDKETIDVLTMARLVEEKGIKETISAMCELPDHFRLHIGGTGPLEKELRELVVNLGIENRVTFLGWVDYESKLELFSHIDVFCLPSKFDSFGMVYLEALSANIPVVALNFQAIPDVVPAHLGVLCDDDNPACLANAIQEAFALRTIKGDEYVLSEYSSKEVTRRFLKNVNYNAED